MVSIDEITSCVQEWMAQPLDAVDLAMTYAEVRMELDRQLGYCMEKFTTAGEGQDE